MNYQDEIASLKEKHNATILAHNYQLPEVQDIADFTGDSLGLSIKASETKSDVIVFCGVYFMAETAKIISPQKKILIPDKNAGCPMADMITASQLRDLKKENPEAKVVCYVNSLAEVKAESNYCCTSANAEYMLREAFNENDKILFVPDRYLGSFAAQKAERNVIVWNGFCASHLRILPEHILQKKAQHPEAEVLIHPEALAESVNLADAVLSTSGMLTYVKKSLSSEFIIGTEIGMLYPLQKQNPDKKFYPASDLAVCPNMKKITLDKVITCLQNLEFEIDLPAEIISRSRTSIFRMLDFVKKA